jgi:hypothetical protein
VSVQSFWDQVGVQALGGAATALVAALLAVGVAYLVTRRHERQAAQRARNETATAEFYQAYGNLFAVWKQWDALTNKGRREAQAADQAEFLARVSDAEGQLESFLIRLTLERDFDEDGDPLVALWCFRRAYKVVRYSVRRNRRVPWFRAPGDQPPERKAGHLHYKMFKRLTVEIAAMIVDAGEGGRPAPEKAAANFNRVTSTSSWVRRRHTLPERPKDVPYEDDDLWFRVASLQFEEAARPDESYGLRLPADRAAPQAADYG